MSSTTARMIPSIASVSIAIDQRKRVSGRATAFEVRRAPYESDARTRTTAAHAARRRP